MKNLQNAKALFSDNYINCALIAETNNLLNVRSIHIFVDDVSDFIIRET